MKILAFLVCFSLLLWFVWRFTQSPEKCLRKKSQNLIELSSIEDTKGTNLIFSRISKISKFIHFDVYLKSEYKGQTYTAKSLNEFRSLLFTYFKQESAGKVTYENLSVTMEENQKKGTVNFDIFFERSREKIFCKALLDWIKEKKWYVKRIEIFSCSPAAS